jgi:hypothetical protein
LFLIDVLLFPTSFPQHPCNSRYTKQDDKTNNDPEKMEYLLGYQSNNHGQDHRSSQNGKPDYPDDLSTFFVIERFAEKERNQDSLKKVYSFVFIKRFGHFPCQRLRLL